MSETLITVEQVKSVEPHPNADRLDVIQVLGYQVVTQKGSFKPGDLCVYFPPDILLPPEESEELGVTQYLKHAQFNGEKIPCRVGAARLRGVPSYGFCAPCQAGWKVGTDVTELYGAKKYVPPVRVNSGNQVPERPNFHRYTDIENLQRYPEIIPEGTPVRITEKIHGCVVANTKIVRPDGSRTKITSLKVGDEVLGMDEEGHLVPTPVLNVFNNGPSDSWLAVKTSRKGLNQGNSYSTLYCTTNHKFWPPSLKQYVEAGSLKTGDLVLSCRKDIELSYAQKQVLLGKMVGGWISYIPGLFFLI